MSSRGTSRGRVILVILLVIAAVGVAIVGGLHLPWTLSWLRDFAVNTTNDSLQGELRIGGVSGSPFSSLSITDVTLATPTGEQIVAVEAATASISWAALLGRGVVVDVELTGVQAFLRRGADGDLNLTAALPAPTDEPSSALPVWLDLRIGVHDGLVVWRDDTVAPGEDSLATIGPTNPPPAVLAMIDALAPPSAMPPAAPHTVVLDRLETAARVVVARDQTTTVRLDSTTLRLAAHPVTAPREVQLGSTTIGIAADGGTTVGVASLAVADWITASNLRLDVPPDVAKLGATIEHLDLSKEILAFVAPQAGLRTSVAVRLDVAPGAENDSVFAIEVVPGAFEPIRAAGRVAGWTNPGPDTTWEASIHAPLLLPNEVSTIEQPVAKLAASIEVEGQGVDPESLRATARLGVRGVDVDNYRIESAYLRATYAGQRLVINESFIQSPYASAAARIEWGLGGDFRVSARAKSTDEVQKLAAALFKRKVDTRADVRIDATGQLDLDREDPVQVLRDLTADVSWDINEFVAEDVRVERSEGALQASMQTEDSNTTLNVSGRLNGRGIRSSGTSIGSLSADVRADSRVSTTEPSTMALLKGLTARLDLDVTGMVSAGAVVRDVDLLLSVAPSGNRLKYDVKGSAARILAGDVRIADAAAKLRGTVTLGETLVWPQALRALEARGQASARGVDASGDAVSSIDAKIDVAGPIANLRGSVSAQTEGLVVGGYAFTSLAGDVKFVGDRVFEVDAEGLQKERVPEKLGVYLKGRYNRELTDFEVIELRFTSTGDAWNLSEGFSLDTARGAVRFNDVTLSHGEQRIKVNGTFEQGAEQELETEIVDLDLASVARDFGLSALEPLRGKLSAEAQIGGTSKEPTATFDIRLVDLYWGEYGPFEVHAQGRYGELALIVEALEVDGYGVRLVEGNATLPVRITAAGAFEVLQERPIEAYLETPKLDPQKLHAAVPLLREWAVQGAASMTIRLGGTLLNPGMSVDVRTEGLTAAAVVDANRIEVGPIESSLAIRYRDPGKENGGFEVSLNAAWADEPPIQILARVQADVAKWLREKLDGKTVDWTERLQDAPWRFVGQAKRFDLRNIRIGSLRDADVEGFATVSIIGDGSLVAPKANIEVKLEGFGWNRYRDVFLDANLAIEKDRVVLKSSRLEWDADEILTASGTIPVPFGTLFGKAPLGDLPIDFKVQLPPTKLAKLSAVDYAFASLKGTAQGFAAFGGTLSAPVIETRLALDGVEFADRTTGGVTIDAALSANDQLDGRVLWTTAGKPALEITVKAPLHIDVMRIAIGEPIDLSGEILATVQGDDTPLAGLVPRRIFDDTIANIAGRLTTSLTVRGTIDKPTFDGRLRVKGGALTISEYSRTFSAIDLDMSAEPEGRIVLHDLEVSSERGGANAQGTLALEGWQPGAVDGRIEVREFGTGGFTDVTMFTWADVTLDGDFSSSPASARATVSNVEVVIPNAADLNAHPTTLNADIVIVRTDADQRALFAVEGAVEPVSTVPYAELAVVIEKGAQIRHPLANVEVGGELTLALSKAGPAIRGEVQASRGTAQFLGKRFEIQQAIVTFTGSDPPDPRLQVEAVYALDRNLTRSIGQATSGEPRAIVRITGRSSDPRIRFLSDPAMSESDVIYVLLTNRPAGQGEVGETGLAGGAASGLLTGIIADSPVGKVFDVRVEAGAQGFSDASVEVGRYIGRDVFISVDLKNGAAADENSSELNIEYRFLPRWIFEITAGNLATGEANIFWDIY